MFCGGPLRQYERPGVAAHFYFSCSASTQTLRPCTIGSAGVTGTVGWFGFPIPCGLFKIWLLALSLKLIQRRACAQAFAGSVSMPRRSIALTATLVGSFDG